MNNSHGKTILLVEDEAIIAISTKGSLEKAGYTVFTANSGEKAFELYQANRTINLILMDMNLGKGMDGPQAALKILKEREIPVIFLSSHTDTEIVEKIRKISSYGYVVKDSGFFVLEASIQMALKLFDAQEKMKLLLEAAKAIISSKTKEEICTNLLVKFCSFIGADRISLFLLDTEKKEILLNIAHGFIQDKIPIGYGELMAGLSGKVIASGKPILSENPEDGNEPKETKARRYADDAGSLIVVPLIVENSVIGTITVINRFDQRVFTQKDLELLSLMTDQAADSINRIHLQEKLRESDNRLREVIENSLDVSYKRNLQTNSYDYLSPRFTMLSGYTPEEFYHMKQDKILALMHSDDLNAIYQVLNESLTEGAEAGKAYQVDYRFKHKNGKYRWFHDQFTVLRGDDGKPFARIGNMNDITSRKQAEGKVQSLLSEKELILKEVHHRIKNNMNTIYGLLVLQAGTLEDPAAIEALEDAGSRVQSMMMLYDKLYRAEDVTEISIRQYLPYLVDQIVNNFPNSSQVKIEKKIDDFILDAEKLQPLGIIINELLTNIMKYAFTGRKSGVITVSALLKDTRVSLTIADDGNGMPESISFGHSTGFGLVLVSGMVKQILGTIRIERNGGTQIILEFDR